MFSLPFSFLLIIFQTIDEAIESILTEWQVRRKYLGGQSTTGEVTARFVLELRDLK